MHSSKMGPLELKFQVFVSCLTLIDEGAENQTQVFGKSSTHS